MKLSLENNKEFTLFNVFKLYKIYWKFLLIFVIASLSLITVYSFVAPVEYEAMATIMPPDESQSGAGLSSFLQTIAGGINIGGIGESNKLKLFGEFLKSREIAAYIADTLNLKNHPWYDFPHDVLLYDVISSSIDFNINHSGIITVTADAQSPYFPSSEDKITAAELSAAIVNTAIQGLDNLNRQKSVSKAKKKREFIERMLTEKKHHLDSVDKALEEFRRKNKVIDLEVQSEAILGNAITIGTQLAEAEIEMKLKMQEFNSNSPVIEMYRNWVDDLKEQYNKIQTGGLVDGDEFSIPLQNVPELIREYRDLMRNQKILEQVNLYLETQKYQEAIQEESDISTVEVLDSARVPIFRAAPNRKLMLIVGLILSLTLATGIITIRSFQKGKVYLTEEHK